MCPYPQMRRRKVLMDMNLFKKIVDDLAHNGIEWLEIFLYSEPLLDPLLFERIKYAKSMGLKVYVSTNGHFLSQEKREAILDVDLDLIGISLDATTKETYEKVRGSKDFERVKENVIALIKERNRRSLKKPYIQVDFVVQKDNCHEAEEFKAFWKDLANKVLVWELISKGKRVSQLVVKKFDPMKLSPRYLYACRQMFYCAPTVLSDGRVVLCNYDYDGSMVLGDFNVQTLSEIWDSTKYKEIRNAHLAGQGDKIFFCKETHCQFLYCKAYFHWWARWVGY